MMTFDNNLSSILRRLDEIERKLDRILSPDCSSPIRYPAIRPGWRGTECNSIN
jgi:hypothetical protein